MPLRLRDIPLTLDEDESLLAAKVGRELGISAKSVGDLRIVRHAVDARRKPRVLRIVTVEFTVADEAGLLARIPAHPRLERVTPVEVPAYSLLERPHRALVVGMGPRGSSPPFTWLEAAPR